MKIAFVGDIMLGRAVSNKYRHQPYDVVSKSVVAELKQYDYVIANLESPIIRSKIDAKDHMCFSGNSDILNQFGWVSMFSLANNHINDFGDLRIKETIEELQKAGFTYNGIYTGEEYAPQLLDRERIVIITLTDLMNHELADGSNYNLLRVDNPEVLKLSTNGIKRAILWLYLLMSECCLLVFPIRLHTIICIDMLMQGQDWS